MMCLLGKPPQIQFFQGLDAAIKFDATFQPIYVIPHAIARTVCESACSIGKR
jgi:hypothetical protein